MIVPEYWAEAKQQHRIDGRQVTIKRYGWSDDSQSAALQHAEQRVDEAFTHLKSGDKVRRQDHKVAYNGAEGLPIREEIVKREQDVVITRNSYGALCLNTADVLFADIDYPYEPSRANHIVAFILLLALSIGLGFHFAPWVSHNPLISLLLLLIALLFTHSVANILHQLKRQNHGGAEQQAMQRIQSFSDKHPDWHLRIYNTPNGLRILVMHRTFRSDDTEIMEFFQQIRADELYVRMCKNQHCFRARISPKPWRIGIQRLAPRPGVWPINPERMQARKQWVREYEQKAKHFAACSYKVTLGSQQTVTKTKSVRAIHDRYCQSDLNYQIA